jgi:lysophospholipase L1-like esterase
MKKVPLVLITAAATLAVIWLFQDETKVVANYPSENKGIIAFGDSLVEGVGGTKGGGFISLLSQELEKPILNLGKSGDTTFSALSRVGVVTRQKPALTIILLGGNDFLQRVPREKTIENLESIIVAVQASGSAVLLIGLDAGIFGNGESQIFENLSAKYRTAHVPDILDGIYGRHSLMADSLHPNDEGYKLIAERIEPTLRKLTQ